MRRAVALAPAKINLGLEITGKRADGYHNIVSILQTITLYDRLEWSASSYDFEYESPPGIQENDDLVGRVLRTSPDAYTWKGRLQLVKGIPIAAGLGGGSSDAALAMRIAGAELKSDGAAILGSDVPFFLEGGTALATGRGSNLEALPTSDIWFVIVTPSLLIPSKTRTLYQSLTEQDFSTGDSVRNIAAALREGLTNIDHPPNAFTRHLERYVPLSIAKAALMTAGAPWVSVSGAGPSLYTLVTDYRAAKAIARRVPTTAGRTFIARSLPRRHGDLAAENLARLLRGRLESR